MAVRKLGVRQGPGGDTAALWDHAWEDAHLGLEVDRLLQERDPVIRMVARYLPARSPVLEAGCGSARVVAYLADRGLEVVGVDFALGALDNARRNRPDLRLAAGDVRRLPFSSGIFQCVISLGVVEHFEEGPRDVLVEHRRVISDDGILLLTVPRLTLLKRWSDWRRLRRRRHESYISWRGHVVQRGAQPWIGGHPIASTDAAFYQYEFDAPTIRAALDAAGFRVGLVRPTTVSLGLRELGVVRAAFQRLSPAAAGNEPVSAPRIRFRERLREFVSAEKADGPVARLLLFFLRAISGHMFFIVAYPRAGQPEGRDGPNLPTRSRSLTGQASPPQPEHFTHGEDK